MMLLAPRVEEVILEDAKRRAPEEACGVVAGRVRGSFKLALAAIPCANASVAPEAEYEIPPEELLRAAEQIEAEGLEVVGFYHSHPFGSPVPSGIDQSRAAWEGASYLIATPEGELASWLWDGKKFIREGCILLLNLPCHPVP